MVEADGSDFVLVADEMPFRRALLLQFLERWAVANSLRVDAVDPGDMAERKSSPNCRMVILSIGGDSLADPQPAATEQVAEALYPDAPLVIIGDSTDSKDVEAVICSNASAYISFGLKAEVAQAALSFVLAGGSYFPPDALRTISHAGHHPSHSSVGQHLLRSCEEGGEMQSAGGLGQTFGLNLSTEQAADSTDGRPGSASGELPSPEPIGGSRDRTGQLQAPCPARDRPGAGGSVACRSNGTDRLPESLSLTELTARQGQVLACLQQGQSNKRIARELEMSEATVKVHVRQIMKKLGAGNRTQAVVLAMDATTRQPAVKSSDPVVLFAPAWKSASH